MRTLSQALTPSWKEEIVGAKGKVTRVYSVNKEKLQEALRIMGELVKPVKDVLKSQPLPERKDNG